MRIVSGFKRELSCADLRVCLLTVAATWFAGALSLLFSGVGRCYCLLAMPAFAPGFVCWLILWMIHFILLGGALGLVLGQCSSCCRPRPGRGMLCWCLYLLCTLLWIPLFFAAGMSILSLLLIAAAVCFGLCTLTAFASRSLLSALCLLICIWWQIYGFLQSLLIILWN
ncbi:MAG: tryptophan-rich sensory protein [Eubacteriales bacterium]